MFGGFTEGLQLFASFAMLMNFPRFNKMKGMGQIVSWSVRDESLHCEGIIKLFHTFVKERDCLTKAVKEDIIDTCQKTVRLEDAFIDLAFEMGPVQGMTAKEIKNYIRYIADWRLGQLGFSPIYMVDEHPLPWLAPLLNGVEHANFFETRATEYSKAATKGELERRVGRVRPAAEGASGERCAGGEWRRAGYVRGCWGGGGVNTLQHDFEPRLPSQFEDLDDEFKGRLRPNKALIALVKSASSSMKVEGGVRFAPIFGESGSGKSSATIQLGTHLPAYEVKVLSAAALESTDALNAEISDHRYDPSGKPLIAVIDQFEETAAEKAAIPSNFVEKVALLDRSHKGRPVLFLWLTTSRAFQEQLSAATSRNTRILVQGDFEVQGPARAEWPDIIKETFSFHNNEKDLADFEILDFGREVHSQRSDHARQCDWASGAPTRSLPRRAVRPF